MAQDTREEIDQERTAQIRQMLAEQNPEVVQQRYGEDVTNTPEYREAEQRLQHEQKNRRETVKKMREQAVAKQDGEELVEVPGHENGRGTVHDPKLVASQPDAARTMDEQEAQRQQRLTEMRQQREAEIQRQQQEQARAQEEIRRQQVTEQTEPGRGDEVGQGQNRDGQGRDTVPGGQPSASDRFNDEVDAARSSRHQARQAQEGENEQERRAEGDREKGVSRETDDDRNKSASDRFNDQVRDAEERNRQQAGLGR